MKTLDFTAMENIQGGASTADGGGLISSVITLLLSVPLSVLNALGLGSLIGPILAALQKFVNGGGVIV